MIVWNIDLNWYESGLRTCVAYDKWRYCNFCGNWGNLKCFEILIFHIRNCNSLISVECYKPISIVSVFHITQHVYDNHHEAHDTNNAPSVD